MHRTIEITLAPEAADRLVEALTHVEGVVGLSRHRGASVMPPGDVVIVHALNRGADEVLRTAAAAGGDGPLSVVTAEVASISDAEHQDAIDRDRDEAVWEELETGLRHQGRVTPNFLYLMALGGVVAAAGALAEPSVAAVAYVASAVIAPGFESVAKLPLGLVLRRGAVLWAGVQSTLAGYAVLILAAAATYLLLAALGAVEPSTFLESDALRHTREPGATILTIAAAGAVAGVVIQAAYRRSVIAGALVAMRLIEAAAVTGIAVAVGRLDIALDGLGRLGIDMGFVVIAGLVVFGLKQLLVHRRSPLR